MQPNPPKRRRKKKKNPATDRRSFHAWILAPEADPRQMVGAPHFTEEAAWRARLQLGDGGHHLKVFHVFMSMKVVPCEEKALDKAPSPIEEGQVVLYTDGSITKNPGGYGGWGCVCTWYEGSERKVKELSGGIPKPATNNIAEMMAVIEGLRWVRETFGAWTKVRVVSDSQYVLNGISSWIDGWKRRGWVNSQGKPVANRELWETMDVLRTGMPIKWDWVKGHAGHPENERADALAGAAAKDIRRTALEASGSTTAIEA